MSTANPKTPKKTGIARDKKLRKRAEAEARNAVTPEERRRKNR